MKEENLDYHLTSIPYSDKQAFWQHHVRLACYFTGTAAILTREDSNETSERYIVSLKDEVVACFRIIKSTVADLAYERTEKGIKPELLEFLVTNWIELVKEKNGDKPVRLLFPSSDLEQIKQHGFKPRKHQRDRMSLNLSEWKPREISGLSVFIRQTKREDAEPITRVYMDAYTGTIDETVFSPEGFNFEKELKYTTSFLNNQSKGYPIIKPACLVAVSDDEIAGFCYACTWRGVPLIWDFAVAKKYQSKGIGRKLLECVITRLAREGYQEVALFVTRGNDGGRKLYHSLGFKADRCTLLMLEKEL